MDYKEKAINYYNLYKEKFSVNQRLIYTIFFYASIVFSIAMVAYWYTTTRNLNNQSSSLGLVSSYSIDSLATNETIKEIAPFWKELKDMFEFNNQLSETINTNKAHRQKLSLPYDNFLYLFYTPSLNIWRDPFTQKIDTSLIGKKYLDNNPYGDIALMEQWTDFFKDVGISDGFNKINNIDIGNIEPLAQPGYFGVTIKVNFESPDKRSFLLLVNKLSTTAYLENISLMNEFVFYVWENVKKDKQALLASTQDKLTESMPYVAGSEDKVIGYLIYDWIVNDGENDLITTDIINKAIRQTAGCIDEDQKKCNYLFRQKMRNIPYLAYGVGRDGVDQVEGFKFFFQHIPPALSIEEFTFEEVKRTRLNTNSGYKGTIAIKVYGKDIMTDEINTISNELGLMCFSSKESMTTNSAKLRVEKFINDMGRQNFDTRRSNTLNQVLNFVNTVEAEYETLPNYKKVVRLFEFYRTLKENSLCDIIDPEIATAIDDDAAAPDNFDEADVLEEIITPVLSGAIDTGALNSDRSTETPSTYNITGSALPDLITGSTDGRTIGDGNSGRDQQLANELEGLE